MIIIKSAWIFVIQIYIQVLITLQINVSFNAHYYLIIIIKIMYVNFTVKHLAILLTLGKDNVSVDVLMLQELMDILAMAIN